MMNHHLKKILNGYIFEIHSSGRVPMLVKNESEQGKHEWLNSQEYIDLILLRTTTSSTDIVVIDHDKSNISTTTMTSNHQHKKASIISEIKSKYLQRLHDNKEHFAIDLKHMVSITNQQIIDGIKTVKNLVLYLRKIIEIYNRCELDVFDIHNTIGKDLLNNKDQMIIFKSIISMKRFL